MAVAVVVGVAVGVPPEELVVPVLFLNSSLLSTAPPHAAMTTSANNESGRAERPRRREFMPS